MPQGYHYWQNSISKPFPFNLAQKKIGALAVSSCRRTDFNNLSSYLFEVNTNIDGKIVLGFQIAAFETGKIFGAKI